MERIPSNFHQEKWRKICEDWAASELSPSEYCQQRKITLLTFYKWRKRVNFSLPPKKKCISPLKKTRIPAREKWWKICENWSKSGLSAKQYCEENKILIAEFFRWRKKLNFPFFKKPIPPIDNWDEIITDWEKSGLSAKKYCEEHNISPDRLYYRRQKISHPTYISVQKKRHKWKEIIQDWEKSGLTPNAYAVKNALYPCTLRHWDKKLNPHKVRKTIQERAVEKWTTIMDDWKKSGLSAFTYCQRKGVTTSPFYEWRDRLNIFEPPHLRMGFTKQEYPEVSLEEHFISIPSSSAMLMGPPPTDKKIEVILPQGHQIHVEGEFDKESLSAWLTLLLQPK